MVVVRADQDPFVFQTRVASLDGGDDVAVGDPFLGDTGFHRDPERRDGNGRRSAGGFRETRELVEALPRGLEDRGRESGGDGDRGYAHRVRPARERESRHAARRLGPGLLRELREVHLAGMVVQVGDVEDGEGSGSLGVERFSQIARVLRGDDAVEGALRALLSRLVIEDERDPAA